MKRNMLVRVGAGVLMFGLIGLGANGAEGESGQWIPGPATPAAQADRAVQDVIDGVAGGNMYVLWDALPESYQNDVTEVVHSFASKIDAEIWNKGFETALKIAQMLENKKDVILSMPNLHESPDFNVNEASAHWDLVVAPIKTIAHSPIADVDAMQHIDIRQFLATTGSKLVEDFKALSAIKTDGASNKIARFAKARATLVSNDGGSAVVRLSMPGEGSNEETFVRVEGKWIPREMAQEWSENIGDAREKLAQMSANDVQAMKPQIMMVFASIDGVLDQMNRATTADEFEHATQMGMMQVFGGLMSLAQSAQAE